MKKTKEKPKYTIWQNVCFMVRTAWGYRNSVLALCLLVAALRVMLRLVQLFIVPQVLAKVEQGAPVGELLATILTFSGAWLILKALRAYVEQNQLPGQVDVRTKITMRINRKACSTSYPNSRDPKVLQLIEQANAATEGNDEPAEHVWQTLTEILINVVGFVIYVMLLSHVKPLLLVVVVAATTLSFFVSRHINEWGYRHRDEKDKIEKELDYMVQKAQSIEIAKDIRIFGLSDWLWEIYGKATEAYRSFVYRREGIYIWADVVDLTLAMARNGIAYWYLIHMALQEGWPASEFLLYFNAISGFTAWVTGILKEVSKLHKESLALSRIQEYLNLPEPFRFDGGKPIPAPIPCADATVGSVDVTAVKVPSGTPVSGYELKLENVTFRYPGTDRPILEHLDLTIRPGEKLAIVGLNGAGKTTLVRLLCGFYDPDEGRVLLNGQDIREFNRGEYYDLFSAVFQEYSLLDVTVAENVAQTAEGIDLERVAWCLEQAGLMDHIAKLPMGLQTHVGRDVYLDGVMLSGGQTQRLLLARALYKDGAILVLDEPTAALDPIAEDDIYRKYNDMTRGKTSVFISHRLASTRFCDRILLVADGRIAEEGTHEELLRQGGRYAELFAVQSRYYQEGGEHHDEEE